MRRPYTLALAAILLPITAQAARPLDDLPDLVDRLIPSVVNITSRSLAPLPMAMQRTTGAPPPSMAMTPEERAKTALGSGFVIDPDGLIVTNNHVIDGAFDITVTFKDGTSLHADVVGTTKIGDIALLQVHPTRKLPALRFTEGPALRVGEPVIAIGNPLGFGSTVTTGIVSALNRDIMLSPFDSFIQTDAAINHGNSGGPLFNPKGEVVGVNTAIYSPVEDGGSIGIGFAIPAARAKWQVEQLRTHGLVKAGDIGVGVQDLSADLATALAVPPGQSGVIITGIVPASPAAQAGLREGDVILTTEGNAISDTRDFARTIAERPLGQPVALTLWRHGTPITATPTVQEWQGGERIDRAALARSTAARPMTMDLGLRLAPLTDDQRQTHGLDPQDGGVAVSAVMANSLAGDRGLHAGDVILRVMDHKVAAPEEVLSAVRGMIEGADETILTLVANAEGRRWVVLPIRRPQ